MATPQKTPAKQLLDQIWGSNFIDAIPLKFRSALKYFNIKTPGVSNDTQPDEIGVDGVINSQVVTGRDNEREKTTSKLDGSVAQHVYHEQELDVELGVLTPKDVYVTDEGAELGQPNRNIVGLVPGVDQVETIDLTAIEEFYGSYLVEFPGVTNLRLPDVLTRIEGVIEQHTGSGHYGENATASGHGSLSLRGSGQSSGSIIPDLIIDIQPTEGNTKPTTNYMFLLKNPVTLDDITAKLTMLVGDPILPWPSFHEKGHNLVLIGEQTSVKADAAISLYVSDGGQGTTQGSGYSEEVGLSVKIYRIPPTIHTDIFVLGKTNEVTPNIIAVAEAAFGALVAPGYRDAGPLSASITPTSFSATPGDSVIPISGKCILDLNPRPYKYGWILFHAEVFDFAKL